MRWSGVHGVESIVERSREKRYDRREVKRERVKEIRGNRKGWWRGVERSSAVEWSSIVEKCNV